MTMPDGDVVEFIFRDNLWHLPLWTTLKAMPSTPAVCSSKATMPSLANNPYASLLDLQDSEEVQPLISLSSSTTGSRRRGRDFRKVTFQNYGKTAAEARAMAAIRHDASEAVSYTHLMLPTTRYV